MNPLSPQASELLDVVSDQDCVTRQATRREIHARGWLHRAVHVLVFNQNNEVFLQQRSLSKDTSPGLWDSSCSGHVDAGEDYDTAVVRELEEEIGIQLAAAPKRWFRILACEATGQEFVWVYHLVHEGPLTLCPEEISGGEWLLPGEVSQRIKRCPGDYCSSFRLIWERVMSDQPIDGPGPDLLEGDRWFVIQRR